MQLLLHQDGYLFEVVCGCGYRTGRFATLEAAGRAYDVHLAEKFPRHSQRYPCPLTMPYSVPFEYDLTPLRPGEHHVVTRATKGRNES